MTRREANLLASARRPNGADDHDFAMAEALAILRQAPTTSQFLDESLDFDRQIAVRFQELRPPLTLRNRLQQYGQNGQSGSSNYRPPNSQSPKPSPRPALPGAEGTNLNTASNNLAAFSPKTAAAPDPNYAPFREETPTTKAFSKKRIAAAAAPVGNTLDPFPHGRSPKGKLGRTWALLCLATATCVGTYLFFDYRRTVAAAAELSSTAFQRFSQDYVQRTWDQRFDFPSSDAGRIASYLAAQPGAARYSPPAGLLASGATPVGCKVFPWNGQSITLISYRLGPLDPLIHLAVVDHTQLTDRPSKPFTSQSGGWNSVTWNQGDLTYSAISTLSESSLSRLR